MNKIDEMWVEINFLPVTSTWLCSHFSLNNISNIVGTELVFHLWEFTQLVSNDMLLVILTAFNNKTLSKMTYVSGVSKIIFHELYADSSELYCCLCANDLMNGFEWTMYVKESVSVN